jgi:hypothetical protein
MPGKGISKQVQEWRFMIEQTRPLLTEAPHLAAEHAALEALIAQVEPLLARAETGKADRLEANRLRREAEAQAKEARARLAAALQHHFGTKSEKLLIYGVAPQPRTIHRTTKAERELAALKAKEEAEKGPEAA